MTYVYIYIYEWGSLIFSDTAFCSQSKRPTCYWVNMCKILTSTNYSFVIKGKLSPNQI